MNQQGVPVERVPVPVSRYHITTEHSIELAQHTSILAWGAKGASVIGSTVCFWRGVMYSSGSWGNAYGNWAFYITSFIVLASISYAILNNCFIAIWRETSGYHMRMQEKHFRGYVYSNVSWIDLAGSMFAWWVNTDNWFARGSLVLLLITDIGGGMIAMNPWADHAKIAGAFTICLILAIVVIYVAINFTITGKHLKAHAGEWKAHIEKPEILNLADVKQRHNLPSGPKPMTNVSPGPQNARLRSGNTITGQILEEEIL